MLGRHVIERPYDLVLAGERLAEGGVAQRIAVWPDFGQAKVEQLDSSFRDQDISRLQVAMRDSLAVRRIESIANLRGILQCLLQGQRSAQRRALDVFHHQVVRPNIVQRTDVGMVQGGHRVRLALEALRELLFGNLDGDDAIQSRVASLIDLSHPARAQGRSDLVRTQPGSGSQSHEVNDCTARGMGGEWVTGYSYLIR